MRGDKAAHSGSPRLACVFSTSCILCRASAHELQLKVMNLPSIYGYADVISLSLYIYTKLSCLGFSFVVIDVSLWEPKNRNCSSTEQCGAVEQQKMWHNHQRYCCSRTARDKMSLNKSIPIPGQGPKRGPSLNALHIIKATPRICESRTWLQVRPGEWTIKLPCI